MVVHWHLTFLLWGQICFPMDLYGKNCWEFLMTSPLEPLGQCCSNFILSLPGTGKWKIARMVAIHWPRWPPCPYMVKSFRNLLLQNCGCCVAQSLHKSSGTGGLSIMSKIMVIHWHLTFLWRGQVCFCMHLYGPHTFVWEKMLRISNNFSEASGPVLLKFHAEPSWAGEWKIAKMTWSVDQNGCHAHIW